MGKIMTIKCRNCKNFHWIYEHMWDPDAGYDWCQIVGSRCEKFPHMTFLSKNTFAYCLYYCCKWWKIWIPRNVKEESNEKE